MPVAGPAEPFNVHRLRAVVRYVYATFCINNGLIRKTRNKSKVHSAASESTSKLKLYQATLQTQTQQLRPKINSANVRKTNQFAALKL